MCLEYRYMYKLCIERTVLLLFPFYTIGSRYIWYVSFGYPQQRQIGRIIYEPTESSLLLCLQFMQYGPTCDRARGVVRKFSLSRGQRYRPILSLADKSTVSIIRTVPLSRSSYHKTVFFSPWPYCHIVRGTCTLHEDGGKGLHYGRRRKTRNDEKQSLCITRHRLEAN